jgi:hypothetical protein
MRSECGASYNATTRRWRPFGGIGLLRVPKFGKYYSARIGLRKLGRATRSMNVRLFARSLVRLSDERNRSLDSSLVIHTQVYAAIIFRIHEKLPLSGVLNPA